MARNSRRQGQMNSEQRARFRELERAREEGSFTTHHYDTATGQQEIYRVTTSAGVRHRRDGREVHVLREVRENFLTGGREEVDIYPLSGREVPSENAKPEGGR